MKKLLLTILVALSVGISYAQTQKVKAPATASTTPAPPVKTPPTAPPKPTARKRKPFDPGSMGIEKEIPLPPSRIDTPRTRH